VFIVNSVFIILVFSCKQYEMKRNYLMSTNDQNRSMGLESTAFDNKKECL
jgi:hypothetical protein